MSNPDKFPYSTGTFSCHRPRKLTYRKYFNQSLIDVDDRFARDLDYLFAAQYIVECKQVRDDGNNFAMRQKPFRQFTAAQPNSTKPVCEKRQSIFIHEKHMWLTSILPAYLL